MRNVVEVHENTRMLKFKRGFKCREDLEPKGHFIPHFPTVLLSDLCQEMQCTAGWDLSNTFV